MITSIVFIDSLTKPGQVFILDSESDGLAQVVGLAATGFFYTV